LAACLDSILSQTFQNWELILVNDNSSDNSLEILTAYSEKDDRITVVDNPQVGLLNTLRLGYKHTIGMLIHRMDSDDKMPHDKLETLHAEWKKHGKGSVITGGTEYFSDEGEIGNGFKRYDEWLCEVARNNSHAENIYRECVIPSNCWLVHREDFDEVGGFDPATFPEDYDLCFRFYKGELRIVGLDKVLHHWRDRPDRISRTREEYSDNRFFELKVNYFLELERDPNRPLVLWGAGKNGKDLTKLIQSQDDSFTWVCDNANKIGKDIYDIRLHHFDELQKLDSPQIIIAVASPDGQKEIESILQAQGRKAGKDYWFFA